MASDEIKGFSITPAKVGFLLSLLAVITFGVQAVSYVNAAGYKDREHDAYIVEDKLVTKEILGELKNLNRKVDELQITMKMMTGRDHAVLDIPITK